MDLSKEGEKKISLEEIDWSKEKIKKIMRHNSDSEEGKKCLDEKHTLIVVDDNRKSSNDICIYSEYCPICKFLFYRD